MDRVVLYGSNVRREIVDSNKVRNTARVCVCMLRQIIALKPTSHTGSATSRDECFFCMSIPCMVLRITL